MRLLEEQVVCVGVNRIGEIHGRASEGQAAGSYGAGFTARALTRKGAKGGLGNKVSSDKELTGFGRMAEGVPLNSR